MSNRRNTGCVVASIVGFIIAAILIFFGVLFIWASSDPEADPGWFTIGVVTVIVGVVIVAVGVVVLLVTRPKPPQEIIQKIDLTGDVGVAKLKCKSCGAELDKDSISLKEGAIYVTCPFCGSSYQMVEEPKW